MKHLQKPILGHKITVNTLKESAWMWFEDEEDRFAGGGLGVIKTEATRVTARFWFKTWLDVPAPH